MQGGKQGLGWRGNLGEELQKILPAKEVHSWLPERQDGAPLFPWQGYIPDPLAGPQHLSTILAVASAE